MSINRDALRALRGNPLRLTNQETRALSPRSAAAVEAYVNAVPDLIGAFEEVSQRLLRFRMTELASFYMAEDWPARIEYTLWAAVENGPEVMSIDEVADLRRLAEWAGGWFHKPDGVFEPLFVDMVTWLQLYRRHADYARQVGNVG